METLRQRDFAPFPQALIERGIGKTVSYELLDDGEIETFCIGRRRYVYLDSLLTLGERLATRDAKAA